MELGHLPDKATTCLGTLACMGGCSHHWERLWGGFLVLPSPKWVSLMLGRDVLGEVG